MINYRKYMINLLKNKSSNFFLICGLLCCLFLLSPKNVPACGPFHNYFEGYSFVMPEIFDEHASTAPFFIGFSDFYKSYNGPEMAQSSGNVEEWTETFCQLVKKQDVYDLIYTTSVIDLELLRTSIRSKNMPLDFRVTGNSFARHLKREKCLHTIDYLIFAKECEPHVTQPEDSWEPVQRDTAAMYKLIKRGKREFRKSDSNYIKLRYAYQLIRLAHYAKNYRLTLALEDELLAKTSPVESIINYWILGHKAGALQKLGQKTEAAYLYSKVFLNCPSKKESAFRSFHIESDEQWKEVLLMCATTQEQANLYALRAHADESKAVEEMVKIYDLDPTNENLEVLLVNEVKKLERDLLGLEFNDKKERNKKLFKIPRKNVGSYVIKLNGFVRNLANEKKVTRPELWRLAEGYLEFLSGDYYAANLTFKKLGPKITDKLLKEQLSVFQLALDIASYENIEAEEENEIADIIKNNVLYKKHKDFGDYLNDKLSYDYALNGNPGKAFRMQYSIRDMKPNPQSDIIDSLLGICKKEKLSKLERAFITKKDGTTIEADLLDMKATLLLSEGKPEAALEAFKGLPREKWDDYQFYVYRDSLTDCVTCKPLDSVEYLNKVELLQELFELEYKARADFVNSSKYYYRLGIAYYNMTYFGTSWQTMDYFRSGANWDYAKLGIFQLGGYLPFGNKEHQDCSKALFYFDKAIDLAKDPELAARASFMAARCEQKRYFTSIGSNYSRYRNEIPDLPEEYREYYDLLISEYDHTYFYRMAVKECTFFAAYASGY